MIILSFLDSFVGTNCSRDSRWEFVSFRRPPTNARRRTHRKDQGRNRAWNSQTKHITNILLQSFIDNITFIFVPKTTFFRCDNKAFFCAICKTKFILKWQETIFNSTHNFGWRAKWFEKKINMLAIIIFVWRLYLGMALITYDGSSTKQINVLFISNLTWYLKLNIKSFRKLFLHENRNLSRKISPDLPSHI